MEEIDFKKKKNYMKQVKNYSVKEDIIKIEKGKFKSQQKGYAEIRNDVRKINLK